MPATEPERSRDTPRSAVYTRYSASSVQVSAAKVLPNPPASTVTKTALKISTPRMKARTTMGSGRMSTVTTSRTHAHTVHRRNEAHQGPRFRASVGAGEPSEEVCSDIVPS